MEEVENKVEEQDLKDPAKYHGFIKFLDWLMLFNFKIIIFILFFVDFIVAVIDEYEFLYIYYGIYMFSQFPIMAFSIAWFVIRKLDSFFNRLQLFSDKHNIAGRILCFIFTRPFFSSAVLSFFIILSRETIKYYFLAPFKLFISL